VMLTSFILPIFGVEQWDVPDFPDRGMTNR